MNLTDHIDEPHWASSVKDFNLYPIRAMHDSWYDHIGHGCIVRQLKDLQRNDYVLSQYVLKQYSLANTFTFDFDDKVLRLCLLTPDMLNEVLVILGAVLNYPSLMALISGKKIRVIKTAISGEYFDFSIKKAPLLLRKPPAYVYGNYQSTPWDKNHNVDTDTVLAYIKECGMRLVGAALGKTTKDVKWRLMWKLPYENKPQTKLAFALANDCDRQQKAQKIILKILKERDLPCCQLFA